jgi:hypothetical protein
MLIFTIAIVEGVILVLFTYRFLQKYAHKNVSKSSKLATFIGWILGFSIICILPLDICLVTFGSYQFLERKAHWKDAKTGGRPCFRCLRPRRRLG